jgi:WD40 repeat protein
VVTGGKAGIVHVLHPKTGTCLERLYGHSGSVHAVQFAPSGNGSHLFSIPPCPC